MSPVSGHELLLAGRVRFEAEDFQNSPPKRPQSQVEASRYFSFRAHNLTQKIFENIL